MYRRRISSAACRSSQPTLGQRGQRDVVQAGHHEVGAGVGQLLLVTEAGHPDRGHAAGLGGLHAARGVLDHEADLRGQVEFLGGGQEDRRIGLAAREVPAGDVDVEQLLQASSPRGRSS